MDPPCSAWRAAIFKATLTAKTCSKKSQLHCGKRFRNFAAFPASVPVIGSLIIVGGSVWIIFWLWRYGQPSADADPSLPVTAYITQLIARYDQQIQLLRSVKFWYLLPCYIGLMISSVGEFLAQRVSGTLGVSTFLFPVIYAAIWWANEVQAMGLVRRERDRLVYMTSAMTTDKLS
jgi:hypothetical protein